MKYNTLKEKLELIYGTNPEEFADFIELADDDCHNKEDDSEIVAYFSVA